MTHTVLNVSGMSCMGCVNSIRKVVEPMPGVEKVDISLEAGRVEVDHDLAQTTVENLKQAIEDAGYDIV